VPPLARIVDVAEASRRGGPAGRVAVTVPHAWLEEGALVEVALPTLVACAACDGGGCDGCARSGAHRLELPAHERTVQVALTPTRAEAFALRLLDPLGAGGSLSVLVLELRYGEVASVGCRRIPNAVVAGSGLVAWPGLVALVVALAMLVAALAWGR
jgi:hypothetical protein